MKTAFAIAAVTYDLVSLENGRALFRAPNVLVGPGGATITPTLEISHLESKNGVRRSLIKVVVQAAESGLVPAVAIESAYVVVTNNTKGGPLAGVARVHAFRHLLEFISGIDVSDFSAPVDIMYNAISAGTFVPEAYVDPSAAV